MYNDYNCDLGYDGYPGEYVFGDNVYIPDHYLDERWKRDVNVPDYFVSNKGRVWSSISNSFVEGTPTGHCGHIDISIQRNGVRIHKYLHRMVAEAFIPNPNHYPIVRHLDDDPTNNYADNLAWGTQMDNMHDCIKNGRFSYFSDEDRELAMQKRRDPVVAIHIKSGRRYEFESQQEASRVLGMSQSSIYQALSGRNSNAKGYYFHRPGESVNADLENYKYSRHRALLKATNVHTGEEFIFHGQTEAAKTLGVSVSGVSMVLSGRMKNVRGYTFEYLDEEGYYGHY